jgi:rod shape determining protein RodA
MRAATYPSGTPTTPLPTRRLRSRLREFDLYLLITTVVLMGFGVASIWSASGQGVITFRHPGVTQALFGLVGLALSFVVASIDYRFFASAAWILYFFGLSLLVLVLIPGIGRELEGAQRWFDLGVVTVQPSEIAKVTTIIGLAAFVASRGDAMRQLGNFVLSMLLVGAPMVLVALEPDLDTALMFGVIWASIIFVTRTRTLYLALLAILAPAAAAFGYLFLLRPFQRERILAFIGVIDDPLGISYQSEQARISIGSGGPFGLGFTGGTQSELDLLSVRTSDFLFAHTSAMFGFVGMLSLFACFVILLWRSLRVAEIARDDFGRCFAMGFTGLLCVQALINIGMNVGLLPVAGIPLPLVSRGVSSLWAFLVAIGILQSILMRRRSLGFQTD